MNHPELTQVNPPNGQTTLSSNGLSNDQGASLNGVTTEPFPASRKVYVKGIQDGVQVPMREIALTPTKDPNGKPPTPNPSVLVYDT
ncbi:MAG: hypothetical protein ACE1ZJ_02300, partial [Nitrospirales bacterium]